VECNGILCESRVGVRDEEERGGEGEGDANARKGYTKLMSTRTGFYDLTIDFERVGSSLRKREGWVITPS